MAKNERAPFCLHMAAHAEMVMRELAGLCCAASVEDAKKGIVMFERFMKRMTKRRRAIQGNRPGNATMDWPDLKLYLLAEMDILTQMMEATDGAATTGGGDQRTLEGGTGEAKEGNLEP